MNNDINTKITITKPEWLNIYDIAGIFPLLSVLVCWVFYYGLKHNDSVIRTISETVKPFPENRIFPVTMCIECIFLGIVIWIRNSITTFYSKKQNIKMEKRLYFMKLSLPFIMYGLSVLSLVTLLDSSPIHLSAAFLFFTFAAFYFIVCDSTGKQLGWTISTFSLILTYCVSIILILHCITMCLCFIKKSDSWRCIGAICQYLACFCLFIKIFVFQYEIPKVTITNDFNKKQE